MADLGVNIWQPAFKQINQIAVTGFFTVGDNPQGAFRRANYTLGDDVHVLIGSHSLNLRLPWRRCQRSMSIISFNSRDLFTFNANITNNAIASFLLGYVQNFSQASGQFLNLRGHFYGFYGQDSWKMTRRFTLDYGLRYEPFLPMARKGRAAWEASSRHLYAAGTHSTVYPLAPAGLQFAGDPGFNPNGVAEHLFPLHAANRICVGCLWDWQDEFARRRRQLSTTAA